MCMCVKWYDMGVLLVLELQTLTHYLVAYAYTFVYCYFIAEIESEFLPWLMDETEKVLDQKMLARVLLDCELINRHDTQGTGCKVLHIL